MKFIFSLNLKGLFKEKKEKKKSQIEDYLSSIKIQMLSYSFFETLILLFLCCYKICICFYLIVTETALQHSNLFQRKFSIFFVFLAGRTVRKENLTFKSQTINYRSQFIYLLESKISWEGSALLGNRLHSPE